MALRYAFPDDADFSPLTGNLGVLPALREPTVVEYNGIADIDDFLDGIEGRHCVKVVGATGVGKSTVLPKLIAQRTGKLVLVVTAHPLLAYCGYDFFRKNKTHGIDASGLRGAYMADNRIDFNAYDVVWASAARLVSWMLDRQKADPSRTVFLDTVVILDEAHEADAYTHVIRTVAPLSGIDSLLMMSATFEPTGHVVDTRKVKVQLFPKEPVHKWRVTDTTKPWYWGNIKSSSLIVVDNDADAKGLMSQYEAVGVSAFRLTARTPVSRFLEAYDAVMGLKNPLAVLIVDSSYRSGFNLDVELIIDSGTRRIASGDVAPNNYYDRSIYNVEYVQTAGRGGRFGTKTTYHRPNVDLEWRICDLEPAEKEAAAYLTRCLGYMPSREIADTVMARKDLPPGVLASGVFNGSIPLAHVSANTMNVNPEPHTVDEVAKAVREKYPTKGRKGDRTDRVLDDIGSASVSTGTRPTITPGLDFRQATEGVTHARSADFDHIPGMVLRPAVAINRESSAAHSRPIDPGLTSTSQWILGHFPTVFPNHQISHETEVVWNDILQTVGPNRERTVFATSYLCCHQVDLDNKLPLSHNFPRGPDTVFDLQMTGELSRVINTLDLRQREFALQCTLIRYNCLTMHMNAIKRAVVESLVRGSMRIGPVPTRYNFTEVLYELANGICELRVHHQACSTMACSEYPICTSKVPQTAEERLTMIYVEKFARSLTCDINKYIKLTGWVEINTGDLYQ